MAEVAHVGEDHRNAVFVSSGNDFIITDGTASKSTYYSLIPSVKLNWYKRDWFGAYSRFGVGPTLRNKAGVNSLKLGYQASLLGLEVGRNFRFFAEGGFGTHGLALVGLRYRF